MVPDWPGREFHAGPLPRPATHAAIPAPTRPGHRHATSDSGGFLDAFDCILGTSPQAQAIRAFGRHAAAVDATALVTGETGTGKGILARAIHQSSNRARAPFVAVNCAGVPETLFESEFFGHVRGAFTGALHTHRGLFEQADRGTLFLDEIGELPMSLQAKLLTALEDGEFRRIGAERAARFDARLIAATGVDLERAVAVQRFRSDLFHRLKVLEFRLPPLRERPHDIEPLARHFLEVYARKYARTIEGIAPESITLLQSHAWPGNIRELAHTIEAAIIASSNGQLRWKPLHSPSPVSPYGTSTDSSGRYRFSGPARDEIRIISDALARNYGNRTRAARMLGMSRNTLLTKIRKLNIVPLNGADG
ncbi:MAG: sigma-54 interaction domain-containing protein [Longimicrobiales bacterium]